MYTKWMLPSLLVIAIIGGLIISFSMNSSALEANYEEARIVLDEEHTASLDMQQQLITADHTYQSVIDATEPALTNLTDLQMLIAELDENAKNELVQDAAQKAALDAIVKESAAHTKETEDVLDSVLATMLGKPIGQTFGKKATIKVFTLKEAGLRGYMAKVKMHDPKALRLVLAEDKVGNKGETTSDAAERTGATLAINAGGFARQDGLLYPMGITVVDGEIKTFYSTELSFIGINKDGQLVGGEVTSREQIEEMEIQHGATFIPTLLKDGKKLDIPSKYSNRKEPRTLIGHFSNGDLLLIVIDGRQKDSSGVTLEEAQEKLLEWNVRDAYNLDGGGSSAFVYKGEVLNNPSDGRERKVVSNFVINP